MYFVAVEDALRNVRIVFKKGVNLFQGSHIEHDEASGSIGERPGQQDFSGLIQGIHSVEVGLAVQLALVLAIGAVMPDDDEDHASSVRQSMGWRPV